VDDRTDNANPSGIPQAETENLLCLAKTDFQLRTAKNMTRRSKMAMESARI
jgi:hypothetical protein